MWGKRRRRLWQNWSRGRKGGERRQGSGARSHSEGWGLEGKGGLTHLWWPPQTRAPRAACHEARRGSSYTSGRAPGWGKAPAWEKPEKLRPGGGGPRARAAGGPLRSPAGAADGLPLPSGSSLAGPAPARRSARSLLAARRRLGFRAVVQSVPLGSAGPRGLPASLAAPTPATRLRPPLPSPHRLAREGPGARGLAGGLKGWVWWP